MNTTNNHCYFSKSVFSECFGRVVAPDGVPRAQEHCGGHYHLCPFITMIGGFSIFQISKVNASTLNIKTNWFPGDRLLKKIRNVLNFGL
jgi:hypothetical protein